MPLWYKGSVKLRYDARTHVTIATPFDTLLEELFLYVASKEHTVAKLADTSQAHTEVEVISDTVAEILCVGTLAGDNEEIARLSAKHDDFL